MSNLRQDFVAFALKSKVLIFGEFTTKAGRQSPYFFNAGLFSAGAALGQLAQFYARTLLAAERQSGVQYDMLFGPAYKGIALASATAVALAQINPHEGGRDLPFAYNRKEAKAHGEGGSLVGHPLVGKVVIIDDVISAGTSVRESVAMIRAAGATPAAVLIALDRMERGSTGEAMSDQLSAFSAVEQVTQEFGIPVISIASLDDLMAYLDNANDDVLKRHARAVGAYRAKYGAVKESIKTH